MTGSHCFLNAEVLVFRCVALVVSGEQLADVSRPEGRVVEGEGEELNEVPHLREVLHVESVLERDLPAVERGADGVRDGAGGIEDDGGVVGGLGCYEVRHTAGDLPVVADGADDIDGVFFLREEVDLRMFQRYEFLVELVEELETDDGTALTPELGTVDLGVIDFHQLLQGGKAVEGLQDLPRFGGGQIFCDLLGVPHDVADVLQFTVDVGEVVAGLLLDGLDRFQVGVGLLAEDPGLQHAGYLLGGVREPAETEVVDLGVEGGGAASQVRT